MLNDIIAMPLPVILLGVVFLLTAIRKVGNVHFPIWMIVTVAAIIVLVTAQISPSQAYQAIDFNILFYLFGVFVIGAALEQSYYLEYAMLHLFKKAKSGASLLAWLIGFSAVSTILLMNDTVAIIGAPAILLLCKKTDIPPLPLLLTLAYTLTLSSVTSPIANPQNLLIANQLEAPFISFFKHLLIPTLINGVLLFAYIRVLFYKKFSTSVDLPEPDLKVDDSMARLAKISVALMLTMIGAQIILSVLKVNFTIPFSVIALVSCSPILLFTPQRLILIKHVDWHTLLFFLSLFIFIESVWVSNYFQVLIKDSHLHLMQPITITSVSLLLSQLISNVPLVALYIPLLHQATEQHYMLLAMASTMAGNLFILGAASNVIIIQNIEKRGGTAFSFIQFSIYGIPLCLINVAVYYWFLT